ncbi:hypothetical protein DVA67_025985 [Solirubrobacter sp. CPCC 204708]|uniref:Biogenesis of lysosome-related organelles complex 1 subunit 7 n=1 Tax=Solirubrobacter deserti TaxID=2282478 RepID=A0ABT4RFG0_9ACTN|nr:hypothetical protein [Solirubrobacter deserti]MBE2319452.1 hypothetical protein [Solirubrobacter deserti]MDA0137264.1 hypothetical protein [Solirubrobacter deserti]
MEEEVMLGPLKDLTRVPNAILGVAGTTVEAARNLRTLERIVTDRLASLDQGLREIVAVLPAVADDLMRVRAIVEPQHERVAAIERDVGRLDERLASLQHTLSLLKSEVTDATELLPDPDAPGPIARAREALTSRA